MNMGKTLKKLAKGASVLSVVLMIFSQSSYGQIVERRYWTQTFLSKEYRPRWTQRYENFGNYDIRKYPAAGDMASTNPARRGTVTPVTYDQFGNFLLPGGEIFTMGWNQSKLGASQSPMDEMGGNQVDNEDYRWVNNVFNNLVIASDEFSNWQTKFMITRRPDNLSTYLPHGGIRTYFTPSTLKLTNFSGFRWDASSRKNNVTLIASAGDKPIYGAHWQSVLGDILKIGATFVSKQRGTISDSHQDIDGSNTKVSAYLREEPRYIYVMITDDSPEDTGPGALVYGIRANIDGKEEKIAFHGEDYRVKGRVFKIADIFHKGRFYDDAFQKPYIFTSGVTSSQYLHRDISQDRNSRGSWLLELMDARILNDLFHKSGETGVVGYLSIAKEDITGDPADRFDPDMIDDAKGKEFLRYFKADMSGGVLEAKNSDVIIYEFLVPKDTRQLSFNVNVANDYCIDIIAPLYSHRQDSDVDDFYEKPLSDAWKGKWSIASYDQKHCSKAPGNVKDGSNQRWVKVYYDRITGINVYGMNMELDWRGLFVRAEFNENNSFWSYPLNEKLKGGSKKKYTSRAWFINAEKDFGKWSVGAELFNYPNEYMQYWAPIDDNDDDDRYVGVMTNGAKRAEYPGLDVDFDRYVDTTWSGEPYLEYFYDSITVGDDFNHNGTIDSREDDSQIDLPYDRDSKGQHYFLKIRPRLASILTFGHYDVRQEYHDGRNFTRYMKFEHHQRLQGIGEFLFYHRTERVKDNYKLDEGNHAYRNNWSLSNIISTRLNFIPNTNIINNARFSTSYAVGDQRRLDGTEEEVIINLLSIYNDGERIKRYGGYSYALEHKVDYIFRLADARVVPAVSVKGYRLWREKRIKELKFMPMLKVVHSYGYSRQNNYAIHDYDRKSRTLRIYPIIRFDYRVAPKTLLRFGIQGFPGFPEMYRTKSQSYNKLYDYDRRRLVLAFENRTLYEGFNLLVMMGMRFSKQKYIHDISKKDPGATEYFITLQSEASQ